MKKIVFFSLIVLLSLSACVPDLLTSTEPDSVDIAATVDIIVSTKAAETFAALASPTAKDTTTATNTPSATATETVTPTETATATETPTETLTTGTLATGTASTGTPATETPDADGTPPAASATSIYPSPTSPISINQPPNDVPRYEIKIINDTNERVYISLQGTTADGNHPITEYDFAPREQVKLSIPKGEYTAVVYIRNDPMVEYFRINSNSSITLVIEKDKIKFR